MHCELFSQRHICQVHTHFEFLSDKVCINLLKGPDTREIREYLSLPPAYAYINHFLTTFTLKVQYLPMLQDNPFLSLSLFKFTFTAHVPYHLSIASLSHMPS